MNHGNERIRSFTPGISVGNLFQDVGLLGEGIITNLDIHAEISTHVKRRVDVNQLDAALTLNLFTHRAILKAGENELVIAPDELVGPALELAAAGIQIEHTHLQTGVFFGTGLVHLLNHLKGQNDITDLAGFTIPDQFHLSFVSEQEKAVLVRQRLVGFQITNDLLLFLFSQSWHDWSLSL